MFFECRETSNAEWELSRDYILAAFGNIACICAVSVESNWFCARHRESTNIQRKRVFRGLIGDIYFSGGCFGRQDQLQRWGLGSFCRLNLAPPSTRSNDMGSDKTPRKLRSEFSALGRQGFLPTYLRRPPSSSSSRSLKAEPL
jgi:hypothetical protein